MKNFKEICRLLMLIALFSCFGSFTTVAKDKIADRAEELLSGTYMTEAQKNANNEYAKEAAAAREKARKQQYMDEKTAGLPNGWSVTGAGGSGTYPTTNDFLAITSDQKAQEAGRKDSLSKCQQECSGKEGYNCQVLSPDNQYHCVPVPLAGTAGDTKGTGIINGCSKNTGLFSGLINTGSKIFQGLRDLIYVVAGFGIIGVAVGGFFGNLNWKWLGAIVIALVVIASTGELITAITGCTDFTQAMITDTLK